jgi:C1A family cysteine protease
MKLTDLLRKGKRVVVPLLVTALTVPLLYCGSPSGSEENSGSQPQEETVNPFTVEAGSVGECVDFEISEDKTVCILDKDQAPENFNPDDYDNVQLQRMQSQDVLNKKVDNSAVAVESGCLQVHDQGELGNCVAHAVNTSLEIMACENAGEGETKRGSDSHLVDMGRGDYSLKEAHENGWTPAGAFTILMNNLEVSAEVWPNSNNIEEIIISKPSDAELDKKGSLGTTDFVYIQGYNADALKSAVIDNANVVVSVPIDKNNKWKSLNGNHAPIIEYVEGGILGYHSILVVGWDPETKMFEGINSWGDQWGDEGHFYMTEEFIENNNCQGFYVSDLRGCLTDADGDGHYASSDEECPMADDLCDDNAGSWTWESCHSCVDADGDGYGVDCDLGDDCDDTDNLKNLYSDSGDVCAEVEDPSDLECLVNNDCDFGYECDSANTCQVIENDLECYTGSDCVTLYGTGFACNSSNVCYEEVEEGCRVTGCPADYTCNSANVCEADSTDETWTDSSTGLMWMVDSPNATYTHSQAESYCNNLGFGGYSDWRLPSLGELRTVDVGCTEMDYCEVGLTCDDSTSSCWDRTQCECDNEDWSDLFLEKTAFYWSSSIVSNEGGKYWGLESKHSNLEPLPEGYYLYVNCVRD